MQPPRIIRRLTEASHAAPSGVPAAAEMVEKARRRQALDTRAATLASTRRALRELSLVAHLVQVCQDGAAGLAEAAAVVRYADTTGPLRARARQRVQFERELRHHVDDRLAEVHGSLLRSGRRLVMDLRRLAGAGDFGVLAQCARGERHAVAEYVWALRNLEGDAVPIVARQLVAIRESRAEIEALEAAAWQRHCDELEREERARAHAARLSGERRSD